MASDAAKRLNERQRPFVDAYIECGVGSEAYRRAGYTARGNAAEVAASRLLRNVQVSLAIDARRSEITADFALTADAFQRRLWEEANNQGPGASAASRVAALRAFAKIYGLIDRKQPVQVNQITISLSESEAAVL